MGRKERRVLERAAAKRPKEDMDEIQKNARVSMESLMSIIHMFGEILTAVEEVSEKGEMHRDGVYVEVKEAKPMLVLPDHLKPKNVKVELVGITVPLHIFKNAVECRKNILAGVEQENINRELAKIEAEKSGG